MILIARLSEEDKRHKINETFIGFTSVVKYAGFVLTEDIALNSSHLFERLLRVSLW